MSNNNSIHNNYSHVTVITFWAIGMAPLVRHGQWDTKPSIHISSLLHDLWEIIPICLTLWQQDTSIYRPITTAVNICRRQILSLDQVLVWNLSVITYSFISCLVRCTAYRVRTCDILSFVHSYNSNYWVFVCVQFVMQDHLHQQKNLQNSWLVRFHLQYSMLS